MIESFYQFGDQTELEINFNTEKVLEDLELFSDKWSQYNSNKPHIAREGLCVINERGQVGPGPALESLYEWNRKHNTSYSELDFNIPTELYHHSDELQKGLGDILPYCFRTHFLKLKPGGFFPAHRDYRGYAGRVASGVFRLGDDITVMPSGFTSKIKSIDTLDKTLDEAYAPMSVSITLEDDIDVSRGDMIVRSNNKPEPVQDIEVMLCWLHNEPAKPRAKYSIRHTSNEQKAMIKDVVYKINIESLGRNMEDKTLNMNDISKVKIRTTKPLMVDSYRENRTTGSIILIDDATNETVAAGMIV